MPKRSDTESSESITRIAIVYNTAWYLYNFRVPLILALQERGYEVHAITPSDDSVPKLEALGVIHHDLKINAHGINPLQELRSLVLLYKKLKQLKAMLVISYTIKCNIYSGLIRPLLKFSHIANIVGLGRAFEKNNFLAIVARRLYRLSIYAADYTFFQNNEDRDALVKQQIIKLERTVVTPGSGIDLSFFTASENLERSKKRIFFMFGRLIPAKGFALFAKVIAELKIQYPDIIEGWIAGGLDGAQPQSATLKKDLESAHAKGEITYLGHREDIRNLIAQSSVVVLPSTYNEGVPRSLLEAIASGKPIITTNWKGCRETVDTNKNGILIPPHDMAALKSAIEKFILMGTTELQSYGKASRAYAEKRFDQKIVLSLYLDAIERLLIETAQ